MGRSARSKTPTMPAGERVAVIVGIVSRVAVVLVAQSSKVDVTDGMRGISNSVNWMLDSSNRFVLIARRRGCCLLYRTIPILSSSLLANFLGHPDVRSRQLVFALWANCFFTGLSDSVWSFATWRVLTNKPGDDKTRKDGPAATVIGAPHSAFPIRIIALRPSKLLRQYLKSNNQSIKQ